MPANIHVESGSLSGRSFPIEKESVRIGSSERCEIRLNDPTVNDHEITLEFINGQYQVFNRGTDSITVEGAKLEARKLTRWSSGKSLQLSGGITLRLKTDSDPRPVPRREDYISGNEIGGDGNRSSSKEKKVPSKANSTIQIIVIVLCFGATAAVLAMMALDTTPTVVDPQETRQVTFDLIYEGLKTNPPQDPDLFDLADRLQSARTNELAGLRSRALSKYRELQILLYPRRIPDGTSYTFSKDDSKGSIKKCYLFVSESVTRLGNAAATK